MTIHLHDGAICLQGACGAEEAETLLGLLVGNPQAPIDLSSCETAHTAVLQILLVARRAVAAEATETFLRLWMMPYLSHPAN